MKMNNITIYVSGERLSNIAAAFSRALRVFFLALVACACAPGEAPESVAQDAGAEPVTEWREDYAYLVGMQAYIYGYPAIRYARDRYYMVERPAGIIDTPINTFFHLKRLADHRDQYGNSSNHDTIYSVAWVYLSEELAVVHAPQGDGRYIAIQLADFYSDVFGYVSPHMKDGEAITYLLVGPDWAGPLPDDQFDGVHRSPTPWVFVVGRVYSAGGDDLAMAVDIQSGLNVAPLSQWNSDTRVESTERDVLDPFPPQDDPLADFRTMNAAMQENPPPERDAALMREFARVGLGPLATGNLDELDEDSRRGLQRALTDGHKLLGKLAAAGGNTKIVNNWFYGDKNWGRMAERGDFLGRASPQAFAGLVEHWVEMATKLRTFSDADGLPLAGDDNYVLRFERDELPKARAFWSITVYDERFNLTENEIGKYLISSASKDLVYGDDGSLEIYMQHEKPDDAHLTNWLPVPKSPFNLFFRSYLPGPEMIEQTYAPPPVRRVSK